MGRMLSELMRRRVPQVLGIYLAAAWGLLEFTDWAVAHFQLERNLTNDVLVALAFLLPVFLWLAWKLGGREPRLPTVDAPPRSVAVLPFANVGGDADAGYLGFGLADQIVTDLARIGDLKVVARTSSFAYEGTTEDVRTIGRRLGARAVLEGSVQRSGDRLRVTTQLINVEDGYHLWSDRYDRPMQDVFGIQDEVADNVARALHAVLRENERKALSKVHTRDVDAYEFYLRGRRFFSQGRRKSLEYARDLYRRAIERDERFALAYAGVAEATALLAMYYPAVHVDLDDALRSAEAGLAIDPELAEAHGALGAVLFLQGKVEAAAAALRRALDLDPRLFEARYLHARACFQQGRFADAVRLFQDAESVREDYSAAFFVAQSLEALGEHERARDAYEHASNVALRHVELNPDDPRAATMLAVSLSRLGRQDEGLRWADRALTIDPEDAGVRYNVACLFAVAGRADRALDCLEEARSVGFGNREWLERDPDLASLRDHPRFKTIMGAM
jgi:adenylate cyclase